MSSTSAENPTYRRRRLTRRGLAAAACLALAALAWFGLGQVDHEGEVAWLGIGVREGAPRTVTATCAGRIAEAIEFVEITETGDRIIWAIEGPAPLPEMVFVGQVPDGFSQRVAAEVEAFVPTLQWRVTLSDPTMQLRSPATDDLPVDLLLTEEDRVIPLDPPTQALTLSSFNSRAAEQHPTCMLDEVTNRFLIVRWGLLLLGAALAWGAFTNVLGLAVLDRSAAP